MASMREIAEKAGVSQATVSRVLSNHPSIKPETKQNVLYWVKKLNYQTGEGKGAVVKSKSNLIGVILPDLINPFFTEILAAVESTANYEGYSIVVMCTNKNLDREKNLINEMRAIGVDGIITVPVSSSKSVKTYTGINIPVVAITKELKGFNSISISHYNGGRKIAVHLLSLGFTKIGYVGPTNVSTSASKFNGFRDTLKEEGYELCDIIELPVVESIESLLPFNHIKNYLNSNEIKSQALFAHDDSTACDLIKALYEHGYKVPQDIAVIGFDNSILSKKCHPSISTLSQPLKEMGDKAVGMIIGLINEEIISISSYELDSRIISRDTTTAQKLKNM